MTKVYCEMINLAQAQSRRDLMAPQLQAARVEPYVHPAFDHRQDTRGDIDRLSRAFGAWGVFKRQDRAITISHAQVWQRFVDSGASHCLVIEDDVYLSHDLGQWLYDLCWWPESAHIVKLERWRSETLKVLMRPGHEHLGREVRQVLSRHTGAAGYMLTRHAAKVLLDQQPYKLTVDQLLFNLNASRVARKLGVAQVTPALVVQGNEPHDHAAHNDVRSRPTGWQLRRQKLQRAYYEIAYPLSTFFAVARGHARLDPVPFAETTLSPQTHGVCA
ncbi:glycosyltransferase family 25 protein [uncultured Tateyamaria sp.]|uniref:glycosyltransferase family 25 protein n=1 Tax=uncultured Tateyamaria sp. TaxID=455651 RepID=UPI0026313507|nr:glycosyltransferase family 25 protein [uncultured Tateyamaria sp.]